VFARPLVYYKRNTPFPMKSKRERGPTQIVWPDKTMSLGFPPDKNRDRDERKNDDNLVVFTSPGEEHLYRRKRLMCLVIGALAVEVIIITCAFALNDTQTTIETLAYISSLFAVVLAFVGMRWRNTRIITLLVVVWYVDCLVGLLRMYTFWDWLRLFAQLGLCQWMLAFKSTLQPTWFVPTNG